MEVNALTAPSWTSTWTFRTNAEAEAEAPVDWRKCPRWCHPEPMLEKKLFRTTRSQHPGNLGFHHFWSQLSHMWPPRHLPRHLQNTDVKQKKRRKQLFQFLLIFTGTVTVNLTADRTGAERCKQRCFCSADVVCLFIFPWELLTRPEKKWATPRFTSGEQQARC